MNCKKCGFILRNDDKVCPSCGEPVVSEPVETPIETIEPVQPVAPVESIVQPEVPVQSVESVTPVVPESVTPAVETPVVSEPVVEEKPEPLMQPKAIVPGMGVPDSTLSAAPVIPETVLEEEKVPANIGVVSTDISSNIPDKKKNSKAIIFIVIGLVLIGLGVAGYFLWPTLTGKTKDEPVKEEKEEVVEKDTVIGNDEYGYLKLPGSWYKFQDVDGKTSIQYTKDSVWIVTLEAYTPSAPDQTAETLAKASLYNLTNNEVGVEKPTGATVTLGDYTAYQVYGLYTVDNTWLVEWFFEPGDGKIHYISVEGTDFTSDYFKIPETFSLTKIK